MGQEMLLLPRMLQAIQILQIPGLELESYLRQAAEENEALVVEDPERASEPQPRRPRASREATDRHDEWLQNQPDRERGLAEVLEEQLALLDADEDTLGWTRFLIRCIDENGYLSLGDDELVARAAAEGLQGGAEALERAQALLATLEPRGIGARNAVDALLRQLEPEDPEYDALRRLLAEFLEELARNKLPQVAREMKLTVDEVRALVARLAELDPRPASRLEGRGAPPIVPDVLVERTAEGFDVRVERSGWPAVAVDPTIAQIARDKRQPDELRRYLRGKIDKARWIVEALEQRGSTLLEIARALFSRQRQFLDRGPGHLAPLKMTDLAAELGLHTSTVSRAVSGKYAQTPWGILPLRHFFQSAGSDGDTARDDVREQVRSVFAAEDRARPLSDDEVVEAMRARGIELARRTVTKYRQELGIPSSYRRRRH